MGSWSLRATYSTVKLLLVVRELHRAADRLRDGNVAREEDLTRGRRRDGNGRARRRRREHRGDGGGRHRFHRHHRWAPRDAPSCRLIVC